jgi:hypothetical protein
MARPQFIEIGGKRYVWREVLRLRREQIEQCAKAEQPALFMLTDDRRPPADRTAAGRYLEPSLFGIPGREG